MAGSVNRVIILGNVGRDPEIRSFSNGGRVANLTVATSETWKDKATGERKEKTEWHKVTIANDALVGVVERYVKKGAKLYIEGQIETRKWQAQDGTDRYSTEIVLRGYGGVLTMLDKPTGSEGMQSGPDRQSNGTARYDEPGADIPF
jgi:single-strand DNA-binding protein